MPMCARPIRNPHDAELAARDWLRSVGFADARLTSAGPDGGVDVRSSSLVAQVKAEMKPTGLGVVQRTYGIAQAEGCKAACFALNGFTQEAKQWASRQEVALFVFDYEGDVEPFNFAASRLAARARESEPVPGERPQLPGYKMHAGMNPYSSFRFSERELGDPTARWLCYVTVKGDAERAKREVTSRIVDCEVIGLRQSGYGTDTATTLEIEPNRSTSASWGYILRDLESYWADYAVWSDDDGGYPPGTLLYYMLDKVAGTGVGTSGDAPDRADQTQPQMGGCLTSVLVVFTAVAVLLAMLVP